ncbi:type III secretion system stator protein SctL [Burkholderia oklahomensis]|uniref:type III secretion system stator protein SctL n=1 Tax=Burkholderia oklahomensis TaxID=342113 RepID=UPI003F513A49
MAIWLRRPRMAEIRRRAPSGGARLGFADDVVPQEWFGELVSIDAAYMALDKDRDAVLAAAHREADRVVAEAAARAEEMIASARSEREAAVERGYRDGYDRAFANWMDHLADVSDAQTRLQLRMRERLADIIASAVEQIVRAESREALFERALASVERIVDGTTYLRVAVHMDDLDRAKATFGTLAERWRELGRPIPLTVVADKRLTPGSCVCESDFGAIDASLDTQLRAMRGAVARALRRSIEKARMSDAEATRAGEPTDVMPDQDAAREDAARGRQKAERSVTEADASGGAAA